MIAALAAVFAALALDSEALRVTIRDDAALEVRDKRTGQDWLPGKGELDKLTVASIRRISRTAAEISFAASERTGAFTARIELERKTPEFLVTLTGKGRSGDWVMYPQPLLSRPGDRLLVPVDEGFGIPVEETIPGMPERLSGFCGGYGLGLSFAAVVSDAKGDGWMALVETPDDMWMYFGKQGPDKLQTAWPWWCGSKGEFAYPRRMRYVFFERGGHVAVCKRFRAFAKSIGAFKTLREKIAERPKVARLLGAVNVWDWEKDKLAVVSNLVAAGIERILWSGSGTAAEVKAIAEMPKALVSVYDVVQDVYRPEQLKKLGWDKGANMDAWPDDVIWRSADPTEWAKAWPVKAKDGTYVHCAWQCDLRAIPRLRRRVREDLKTYPYNTRFMDVISAAPWQECWNPAHPMTRGECRRSRGEQMKMLMDEFGLVVGSERGIFSDVPYCDYLEGKMSQGFWRDDEGSVRATVTNIPEKVRLYNLGEKYRLPLWELVYHDCVVSTWHWSESSNRQPELWRKRDLFNILYGTVPMFTLDAEKWARWKDRFVESYRTTSKLARAVGLEEMTDHRILSPDRSVQQTRFANGVTVTVDFRKETHRFAREK